MNIHPLIPYMTAVWAASLAARLYVIFSSTVCCSALVVLVQCNIQIHVATMKCNITFIRMFAPNKQQNSGDIKLESRGNHVLNGY